MTTIIIWNAMKCYSLCTSLKWHTSMDTKSRLVAKFFAYLHVLEWHKMTKLLQKLGHFDNSLLAMMMTFLAYSCAKPLFINWRTSEGLFEEPKIKNLRWSVDKEI